MQKIHTKSRKPENEADKLRLEVAVGIVKDVASNYPKGSAEQWAVGVICELLASYLKYT